MSRRTLVVVVLSVVSALSLAGCSSSDDGASNVGGGDIEGANTPTPGQGDAGSGARGVVTDTVSIKGFEFNPDQIEAASGATITVTNDDASKHTLTADDASFDTGVLEPGESKTVTVSGESVAPFHCEIHEFMTGQFVVEAE